MSRSLSCLSSSRKVLSSSLVAGTSSLASRKIQGRNFAQATLQKRPSSERPPYTPKTPFNARRETRHESEVVEEDVLQQEQSGSKNTAFERRDRQGATSTRPRQQRKMAPADYSTMRSPDPAFADHLNGLFPGLQFPQELARRILTHASHPAAVYGHNAGLGFLGRRVLNSYLLLLLSSSQNLRATDDLDEIVSRALNTYVLGEYVGSEWGLGRIMKWTPTVKAETLQSAGDKTPLLKSVGLYKVQGDTVSAVVGGIYHQFGGSVAHRVFHTRLLPHLLLGPNNQGLPEAFHGDARAICNEMGGMQGQLVVDSVSVIPPELHTEKVISHTA
ncbi:hypothetical protein VNI00_012302 [Paramarasmius palmivorus]|uniref:RNase III domain-containing protein n=1 Tax=Paramarasmius palmivorus TaxID=297713 RepID=A0AAW0C764_9AGAR